MSVSKSLAIALMIVTITCVKGSSVGTSKVTDSPEHKALMFRAETKGFHGRTLSQTNLGNITCPSGTKFCAPLTCIPTDYNCCPTGGWCPPNWQCGLYYGWTYCISAGNMLQAKFGVILGSLAVALFMMIFS